jgi:glycosyltransferase 2 family protein
MAVIASLAIWGLVILEYWLTFRFLGLDLSLQQIVFILLAARLAMLLPTPGGLGSVEASQVLAVGVLGFHPAYAVGLMLLARARDLSLAGLGILLAFALTRIGRLRKFSHTAPDQGAVHQEV